MIIVLLMMIIASWTMLFQQTFPIFQYAMLLHEIFNTAIIVFQDRGNLLDHELVLAPRTHRLLLLHHSLASRAQTARKGVSLEEGGVKGALYLEFLNLRRNAEALRCSCLALCV